MSTQADRTRALLSSQSQRVRSVITGDGGLSEVGRIAASWKKIQALGVKPEVARRSLEGLWMAVDDDLQEATIAWLDAAAPAVGRAFHEHFTPFVGNALDKWPVKTGQSRNLLAASIRPAGAGTVAGELFAGAPYSLIIKWAKAKRRSGEPGKSVWWDLVRRPWTRLPDAMAKTIEAELGKAVS